MAGPGEKETTTEGLTDAQRENLRVQRKLSDAFALGRAAANGSAEEMGVSKIPNNTITVEYPLIRQLYTSEADRTWTRFDGDKLTVSEETHDLIATCVSLDAAIRVLDDGEKYRSVSKEDIPMLLKALEDAKRLANKHKDPDFFRITN